MWIIHICASIDVAGIVLCCIIPQTLSPNDLRSDPLDFIKLKHLIEEFMPY